MPVCLHGFFHPFEIKLYKAADPFYRYFALAVGSSDGLHADL